MKINAILHTNGKGFWSNEAREVRCYKIEVDIRDWQYEELDEGEEIDFGELRVFFRKITWNIMKHGLIYTDSLFLKELKTYLKTLGAPPDFSYSEQGMQNKDYVSLDCGKKFIRWWKEYSKK